MRPSIPLLLGALSAIRPGSRSAGIAKVPSYKIEQKKEETIFSKRQLQRMKGKKIRMNRGRNRKPQDTALYAMLRK